VNEASVIAWDGPTRVFKWALVFVVLDGWISNTYGASIPAWHKCNGYAALVLIVFRIFWGFVGGSTARFTSFFAWPSQVLAYLRTAPKFLGHNPLGGWMVLALLALVAAMGTAGLFAADEDRLIIEGPLAKTISDAAVDVAARWHRYIFTALEVFVAVHITANVIYAVSHREPLIQAMVSGRKPAGDYADLREAAPGSWSKAAICVGLAAAVVFGAIYALGGRPF
jgi:cytochrome b